MNVARHHTDQADSRETLDSLEEKLASTPHLSQIQLTSEEARARAQTAVAVNTSRSRCTDCPCDGMGAIAAAVLIAVGVVIGSFLTFVFMGGLT